MDRMNNTNDPSVLALEGHLRSMILNNTDTTGAGQGSVGSRGDGFASGPGSQQPVPEEPPGPPTPKSQRKRLNQAQRRQMNAQLSIDIDPRAQAPPIHANLHHPPPRLHSQSQQQSRGHRYEDSQHQSHQYNTPPAMRQNDRGGGLDHRSQGSWHAPASYQTPRPPGFDRPDARYMPNNSHPSQAVTYNDRQRTQVRPEDFSLASELLEALARDVIANSEIERSEIAEKEEFRLKAEHLSRQVIAQYELDHHGNVSFPPLSVELKCFGSLSSGFATKASDMDLGLLSPFSSIQPDAKGSPIPRILEKVLLDVGVGARLLTKTRVPIIKLCQNPPKKLYDDLVEARMKWEQEEAEGLDAAQEGKEEEEDRNDPEDDAADQSPGETENAPAPSNCFDVPIGDHGETQTFHLQQDIKNMASYYALAKRVLRKAGGRDVTTANGRDLSQQEWLILNRFCEAFVRGLTDPLLRERLHQYPSLSFPSPYEHSLLAVFIQAEGEEIVQSWERSSIKRLVELELNEPIGPMKYWRNLLWQEPFRMDPAVYAKELQAQLDKVRRVASVQLNLLEQTLHESPAQYLLRTQKLATNLQRTRRTLSRGLQNTITDLYVSGIHQETIKQAVSVSWQQHQDQWDLEVVARRHASLHLALELEKALEKSLYEEDLVEHIKLYINILRQPLQRSSDGQTFVVAIPPQQSNILATIEKIKDPHLLAPNQQRNRYRDGLEFPKTGAGVQCDINFAAHLALHNTQLLRCYSLTDARVRPMVLFIKHWAKKRGINSGYHGTLSSYGYVLMVLHYLVNVAQPFVSPNLQQLAPPPPPDMSPADVERSTTCRGYNVHFWRNEPEITHLAQTKQLNWNQESVGSLLRGFFEYFAQSGLMSNGSGRGFDWGREVLSLRTQGGIISKQSKGWTGAKTIVESTGAAAVPHSLPTETSHETAASLQGGDASGAKESAPSQPRGEVKEVRLRYLFAIEDPFEIDHNVARTVTHNGIVSIRDEFRRAWRIIRAAAQGNAQENLLDDLDIEEEGSLPFLQLLADLHGRRV